MDDIDFYLKEDLGQQGDVTSDSLFIKERADASIIAKEDCIVAGLVELQNVFKKTGAEVVLQACDGQFIKKGFLVALVSGPARSVLKGERLALNFIGRMSGIASETKKIVDMVNLINPNVKIAATRKTTPGFRKYEKKAVVIGGGQAHRSGLFDGVIIKDNHLKLIDSVHDAVESIRLKHSSLEIEVEVETLSQAVDVALLPVDVIMLDNFSAKDAAIAYKKIKEINPNILIEISGGITPSNIKEYALCADRISLGHLTTSIKNKDFSLEIH
ncbi:MAG: carboxylating nicotinate-nucleotide diphosphorylase [Thermoplasmatota archaeon]